MRILGIQARMLEWRDEAVLSKSSRQPSGKLYLDREQRSTPRSCSRHWYDCNLVYRILTNQKKPEGNLWLVISGYLAELLPPDPSSSLLSQILESSYNSGVDRRSEGILIDRRCNPASQCRSMPDGQFCDSCRHWLQGE